VRQTYRSLRRPRYRSKNAARRWLAAKVFQRELWKPNRRSAALGIGIGLAVAMLPPVPVQMLLAVFIGVLCHANIPLAAATVWVSNPVTAGPILLLQREIGRRVLPTADGIYDVGFDFSLETLRSVTFGVIVTATVLGLLGFALVYWIWGWFQSSATAEVLEIEREG
jgi:hypothetical protein